MTIAIIFRLLRIIAAYSLASLITGYVVYGSVLFSGDGMGSDARSGGIGFGLMVTFFIAVFAACPAALTVAVGEIRSWRMWWYYSIAGSLIGLGLGIMFSGPAFFPYLGVSFGVVSGAIYWWLAGRVAGLADDSPRRVVALILFALVATFFIVSWSAAIGVSPF